YSLIGRPHSNVREKDPLPSPSTTRPVSLPDFIARLMLNSTVALSGATDSSADLTAVLRPSSIQPTPSKSNLSIKPVLVAPVPSMSTARTNALAPLGSSTSTTLVSNRSDSRFVLAKRVRTSTVRSPLPSLPDKRLGLQVWL